MAWALFSSEAILACLLEFSTLYTKFISLELLRPHCTVHKYEFNLSLPAKHLALECVVETINEAM